MTPLPPELVDAIAADPEDDGPRLAAADWYQEQGDPDAAALVRTQLRLARRRELRLSSREVSRLNALERDLLARHEERWVAGALGLGESWCGRATWERGFVSHLMLANYDASERPTAGPPDAGDIRALAAGVARLAAHPLLTELMVIYPRPLPAELLGELPRMPLLGLLSVDLELGALRDVDVVRLADQPVLNLPHVRLNGPAGDRSPNEAEGDSVRARRAAALADAPADRLLALLRPHTDRVRVTRCGRVSLALLPHCQVPDAVLSRVPGLADIWLGEPRVPAWLAAHPDLRALAFRGLSAFDPAPLAGLRRLHTFALSGSDLPPRDAAALCDWLASLPELRAVALPASGTVAECAARLGRSKSLRVLYGPGQTDAVEAADASAAPETVADGVTLRLPDGLTRVPTPEPRGDAEPLAAWAEWGDGDPLDRVGPHGPLWLVLERVPFRVAAADVGRFLTGPPGELAPPRSWSGLHVQKESVRRHTWVTGECPFGGHLRALWAGRRSALRLRAEWGRSRLAACGRVARDVAESLEWDA